MQLLRFLLRTSKTSVIFTILAGLVAGLSSAGLIALMDAALNQEERTPSLAWAFVGLCTLMLCSNIASEATLIRLSEQTIFRLRIQMSRQILATPLRQLEELGAARLMTTLTTDVITIAQAIVMAPILFIDIALVFSCIAYLIWLSWQAFLVGLLFVSIGILTYQIPLNRAGKFFVRARQSTDELFGHLRALTEGTKELQIHQQRREAFFSQDLHASAARVRDQTLWGLAIFSAAGRWGQLLFLVFIGLTLFALPDWLHLPRPVLTGYTLATLYIMGPLVTILNLLPGLGRAEVALKAIQTLGLSLSSATNQPPAALPHPPAVQCLELAGVTHTYARNGEPGSFSLGPVDLVLHPGEITFLVGGNGSGKTTLAKLLLGLYTPETGDIYWDGQRVTEANREAYRQNFSVVFSDFFLFETLLGQEAATLDERAHQYLIRLQLDHKVQIENGKFSTTALSQGQRKRLALLTAYLEDRPVYVFDEWAADQDPVFREIFYAQILPDLKQRGKIVLVITHDEKYFPLAERLLKLDYGKLVADLHPAALTAIQPQPVT